jgi:hypothetical protein
MRTRPVHRPGVSLVRSHQRGRDGGNAEKSCGFAPTITTPWCGPFPQVRLRRLARTAASVVCFLLCSPRTRTTHRERPLQRLRPGLRRPRSEEPPPPTHQPDTNHSPALQRPTHTRTHHRQSPVKLPSTLPTPLLHRELTADRHARTHEPPPLQPRSPRILSSSSILFASRATRFAPPPNSSLPRSPYRTRRVEDAPPHILSNGRASLT